MNKMRQFQLFSHEYSENMWSIPHEFSIDKDCLRSATKVMLYVRICETVAQSAFIAMAGFLLKSFIAVVYLRLSIVFWWALLAILTILAVTRLKAIVVSRRFLPENGSASWDGTSCVSQDGILVETLVNDHPAIRYNFQWEKLALCVFIGKLVFIVSRNLTILALPREILPSEDKLVNNGIFPLFQWKSWLLKGFIRLFKLFLYVILFAVVIQIFIAAVFYVSAKAFQFVPPHDGTPPSNIEKILNDLEMGSHGESTD